MAIFDRAPARAAVLFLLIMSAAIFSGCGEKEQAQADDDETIIESFKELYGRAKVLNTAVFGEGFAAEDAEEASREYSTAHYCKAAQDCPYKNTDEFREAIGQTFSEAYAQSICELMFEGVPYGTEEIVNFQPRYKDIDGRLAVDVSYGGFSVKSELDTERAQIKEKKAFDCIVTVPYLSDGKETGTIDVRMVKEKGFWRLDSATY